jgi:hypothetical protein
MISRRRYVLASPERLVAPKPEGEGGSLTTEYPANGSFFRPRTRSAHETFRGVISQEVTRRKFEFLMVKLLRVYGECLGTKSR